MSVSLNQLCKYMKIRFLSKILSQGDQTHTNYGCKVLVDVFRNFPGQTGRRFLRSRRSLFRGQLLQSKSGRPVASRGFVDVQVTRLL